MNVEGDFRYVDSEGFDECADFLEYLKDYHYDWEEAFVGWIGASKRWKEERRMSKNYWGPLNLVKVPNYFLLIYFSLFYNFFLCIKTVLLITHSFVKRLHL